MPIYLSPGVYTREVDWSLYSPQVSTSVFGVVGTANKGTLDSPTLITDEGTLVTTFGTPAASNLAMHAAARYLRKGRQCYFVRVSNGSDAASTITINDQYDTTTSLTVTAITTGSWGDNLSIRVTAGTNQGYRLTVLESSTARESFDNLLLGAANASDDDYIETRINGVSEYITVVDTDTEDSLVTSSTTTHSLTGGDSGGTDYSTGKVSTSAVIGTISGTTYTGLKCFRNQENIDIDIVAAPGRWERAVVAELISLAEDRADCIALIDPPVGLSVTQVMAWHNGTLTGDSDYLTAAITSNYAALYYPWLTVYDSWTAAEITIPPSGHVAGVFAYTDYTEDPWVAPAGLRRGKLVDVTDTEHSPTLGERDQMYSGDNAVNPIVNFANDGVVVYGQRTLQRTASSLDRLNVRRMLIYLEQTIADSVRALVFEPNDQDTWRDFINLVTPVLQSVKSRRGIEDFRVICDSTTNTAAVINQNTMVGRLLIKPMKAAEFIQIDFVLLPTGASFDELT